MILSHLDSYRLEAEYKDGTKDVLRLDNEWGLAERGGFGSTGVNYITEYGRDGEKILGYRIATRPISLTIIKTGMVTRNEYNQARLRLLDFARPNQHKSVRLVVSQGGIKEYGLDIYPTGGASFPAGEHSVLAISEPTEWTAFAPIFYEMEKKAVHMPPEMENLSDIDHEGTFFFDIGEDQLVFPVTLTKGGNYLTTGDLDYQGSWHSFPDITLEGPYGSATVLNTGTNVGFSFITGLEDTKGFGAGANDREKQERRIYFDEEYHRWNVTDQNGVNKRHELEINSDLINFAILPKNLIDREQKIDIILTGVNDNTRAKIEYQTRYWGI